MDEWGKAEGLLIAFNVAEDGELTKLNSLPSGGLWPCHSSLLDTLPPRLVTASYKGSVIAAHSLLSSGGFDLAKEAVQYISFHGHGEPGPHPTRQQQQHPHAATADPQGRVVVIPDLGTDDLRVYSIKSDGTLELHEIIALTPHSGPRHVFFDSGRPSGPETVLYVLNELSNSISTFSVTYPSSMTSAAPAFTLLQDSISLLPSAPTSLQSPFPVWHAAELAVTTDHLNLIASNRAEGHDPLNGTKEGDEDLFAIFDISAEDGRLVEASKQLVKSGGRAPRHFSLSSEGIRTKDEQGKWLAVAHHDSDEIVIFELGKGGALKEVVRLDNMGRPGCIVWA